jgi:hypothetical protein
MWIVIKILGLEVLAVGIGLMDDDDTATRYIDNSGGSFELAPEETEGWEPSEDWEYEEDASTLTRRPPFGFLHA